MLAQVIFSRKNKLWNFVLVLLVGPQLTNCLFNVDLHSTNKFLQENNIYFSVGQSRTTLHKEVACAKWLGQSWLTEKVYKENNPYNEVSTILAQHCITILSIQLSTIVAKHCIRILSSQCCPNMRFQIKTEHHLNSNWTIWAKLNRTVTCSRLVKDVWLWLKRRLKWIFETKILLQEEEH